MIKIKENNKDVNEFNYLYEEVGWEPIVMNVLKRH